MRKLAFITATVILLLTLFVTPASAATYEPDFEVQSKAVYLENLNTGAVLYEKNADQRMYPASLTKIMTAIVVLENVKDLDGEMAEYPLYIQNLLYGTNASLGGLVVGERLSIRNLLYSALVQSANESAMILANYVGNGSIGAFVEMMNQKAAELGCSGTHFTNPTGLHNDNHYTTARDMAVMAKYALENETFAKIVSTYVYDIGPTNKHESLMQYSTNRMLIPSSKYFYGPICGVKTGTTDEAGRCFVGKAASDGYQYLSVVLGSPETAEEPYMNFMETRRLYKWAFNHFTLTTLYSGGELLAEVPVRYSSDGKIVQLFTKDSVVQLLHDEVSPGSIQYTVEIPEYVKAPIEQGETIGTLHVRLADEEIGTMELVAGKSYSLSWFKYFFGKIGEFFGSTLAKVILVLVVLLVGVYIYFMIQHNKKKKAQRKYYRQNRY